MEKHKKEMIGKRVKVNYTDTVNGVCRDEGLAYDNKDGFLVLELDNKNLKWISLSKIIRVEEI